MNKIAIVYGGAGFIGSHMVKHLLSKSEYEKIYVFDIKKKEEFEYSLSKEVMANTKVKCFYEVDLSKPEKLDHIYTWTSTFNLLEEDQTQIEIYQFAADMGGAGYIFTGENDFQIMTNSVKVNLNLLNTLNYFFSQPAAYIHKWKEKVKVFYSSSACIYPKRNQESNKYPICTEESAYPAEPDSEYGWEKLFSERLYLTAKKNIGLDVKIARYHNIFGTHGAWNNGKEKAPAAITRKVLESIRNKNHVIEVWGDGKQTRSFLWIDDCIEATYSLMQSNFSGPYNIGSEEMVSIDELVKICFSLQGVDKYAIIHIDGPVGVAGRNSFNDLIKKDLNWEPKTSLEAGLNRLQAWMNSIV